MTHQIVGIGDIHLKAGHERNAARLKALDGIIEQGLALPNLAAWLQLGDVFDGRSGVQDRIDLADRLQRMANRAPVVIVQGNHCVPGDLDVFARLTARWPIFVSTAPQVLPVLLATGPTLKVLTLPYPSKAALIAGGVTADATVQVAYSHLEAILRALAAEDGEGFRLFAAHVNVIGALTSTGQPVMGQEISIDRALLDLLGPMPKVMGHIHAPQSIGDAYYAGSISANSWGETEEKRWLLVEIEDDGGHRVISQPIRAARLFHVEGQLGRDGFTVDATDPEIDRRFLANDWEGCEVRVRYTFLASERGALNEALVTVPFTSADRLQVEPVAIPDRALRAPEVATARTLREKVEAWARTVGAGDVKDSLADKLARLETEDAVQLLSAVADALSAIEKEQREEVAA